MNGFRGIDIIGVIYCDCKFILPNVYSSKYMQTAFISIAQYQRSTTRENLSCIVKLRGKYSSSARVCQLQFPCFAGHWKIALPSFLNSLFRIIPMVYSFLGQVMHWLLNRIDFIDCFECIIAREKIPISPDIRSDLYSS